MMALQGSCNRAPKSDHDYIARSLKDFEKWSEQIVCFCAIVSTSGVLQWMEQLPEYQLQHRAPFGPFANGENFGAYYPHFRLSLLLLPISTFSMIYFPSSFFSVNLFSFFYLFPNLFSFFLVFDYQFSFFHLFGNLFPPPFSLFLPIFLFSFLLHFYFPFSLFPSLFLFRFYLLSFFNSKSFLSSLQPLLLFRFYLFTSFVHPRACRKKKNNKKKDQKKKEGERSRRVIPRTETKEEVGNKRKITGESFRFHVLARGLHKKLDFTQNAFCFYMLKGLMADPTRLLTVSSRFYELNL